MSRCDCGSNTNAPGTFHANSCPLVVTNPEPDREIQLRPRTPKEYRAYVQGFLYGVKMANESHHDLPTAIALETFVEGYRQMVGYPGVTPEGEDR